MQRGRDMTGAGNEAQVRIVAEQVAEAAVDLYARKHPQLPIKAEIPAPLKWAGAIIAALMVLMATGGMVWGVGTLNELQITVARMDERQQQDTTQSRLEKIEERLSSLERGGMGREDGK